MRIVRLAVATAVVVAVGGAAYLFKDEIAQRLGIQIASAAEKNTGSGAAASAQPPGRRGRASPGGPVPVVVAPVALKSTPIVIEAVGTVQAIASIQIKPRLDSQIVKVHVAEGALVKEGDLLFQLDDRTLKAQLGQIEAQIRKDQSQLVQARRDVARTEELLAKGAGTQVQRDTASTALKAAEAQLEADEANRTAVLTSLSYTVIKAPVSGRIGSIAFKAGAIVRQSDNAATAVLGTINQIDPIFVTFAIPQVLLPDLRSAMAKGEVKVNAIVTDDIKQPGAMAFIENTVDPNTGTVMAKASIANANEALWPGQFVRAEVILGVEAQAISIPSAAVQLGPQGPYVFVVKDNVAQLRPIDVKRTQHGETIVAKGVAAGESVVVDGQLRLVNGANVAPRATPTEPPKPATPPRG
jgi:multidrug efflux system membrane fusion protein